MDEDSAKIVRGRQPMDAPADRPALAASHSGGTFRRAKSVKARQDRMNPGLAPAPIRGGRRRRNGCPLGQNCHTCLQTALQPVIPVAAAKPRAQPDRGRTTSVLVSGVELSMKWGAVTGGVALAALASLPGLLSESSPAGAADMTVAPRPATSSYIPAQFFWTGFYIG